MKSVRIINTFSPFLNFRWNKETITEDQMKLLWGNRNRKLLGINFELSEKIL